MNAFPVFDAHINYKSLVMDDIEGRFSESDLEGFVLIQSNPSQEETEKALKFAESNALVSAASVWVDIEDDLFSSEITKFKNFSKMRGVILPVNEHKENYWLLEEDILKKLKLLSDSNLTLDLVLEPRQIPSVQELAKHLPELKIMVTSIGSPYIARNEREPWGVYMMNLATEKNVYVKLNGLPSLDTLPKWSTAHLKIFVEPILRLFGYSRVVYGGDDELDPAHGDYRAVFNALVDAVSPLTDGQYGRIFAQNGKAFYGVTNA